MQAVKLTNRLSVQFFKDNQKILIIREKPDGKQRKIYADIRLIKSAFDSKDKVRGGETIYAGSKWKLTSARFGFEEYVCFVSEDDKGERVPYECFNLTFGELEKLQEELHLHEARVESEETSEPETKRPRTTSFFQESYGWELCRNGKVEKKSPYMYVTFKKCKSDAMLLNVSGEYTIQYACKDFKSLHPWGMIHKVYQYLIKTDFNQRMIKFCPGCINEESQDELEYPTSQEVHLPGCVHGDSKTLSADCISSPELAQHLRAAHLRISPQRLIEATHHVSPFFNLKKEDVTRELINLYLDEAGIKVQIEALQAEFLAEMSFLDSL